MLCAVLFPVIVCAALCEDGMPQTWTQEEFYKTQYAKQGVVVLPDTLIKLPENAKTYVAIKKIIIPRGIDVQLPAGKNFYFEPGTSLQVYGTLSATGTKASPIYCMLMPKDKMPFEPTTADTLWNGIVVKSGGRLILNDVAISGTHGGIQSDAPCDSLFIVNVTFSQSTGTLVAIDSQAMPVQINMPYTLDCSRIRSSLRAENNLHVPTTANQQTIKSLRIGLGGVAIAGVGVAAFGLYQFIHNLDLYRNSTDPKNNTTSEVNTYRINFQNGRTMAILSSSIAVLAITGYSITLHF